MDRSNEILTIEVGAFGLRAGRTLREAMLSEHWIDLDGKFIGPNLTKCDESIIDKTVSSVYGNNYDNDKYIENSDVYFDEVEDIKSKDSKYVPRWILIDEGTRDIERICWEPSSRTLSSDMIMYSNECSLKNSFKYQYGINSDNAFLTLAYDNIISEIEKCDQQPAIQLLFALEGGFGPGFLKFFANCIFNELSSAELIAHVMYPDVSRGNYPCGLGLYNCVEGMSHLIELTELTFIYNNEGLSIINEYLYPEDYVDKPGVMGYEYEWERNNQVIADYISDITSPSRFPLYSSWWYKKLATNMVQFPRLHFLSGFLSPLECKNTLLETDQSQNSDLLFKNLQDYNLSLASFIDLRTKLDIKNHMKIESTLLNSSGIFRLSDESEVSDIELNFQQYWQNYGFLENGAHQAYSGTTRVNAWTGEPFHNHAAFTVNSHAMK